MGWALHLGSHPLSGRPAPGRGRSLGCADDDRPAQPAASNGCVDDTARSPPALESRGETHSIDRLSGGRLTFGAGLGFPPHAEFELFGEDPDDRIRARKLDEGLAILDGLWSGEPFSFQGEHFNIEETTFLPPPVQVPRPPVWIAGWWPNKPPLRRAARWDGVFSELVLGGLPSPDQLREILAYVHDHRESSNPFDAALNGYTDTDPSQAAETVGPYAEAGLTWWLERIDPDRRYSVAETLERIEAGPPHL